MKRDYEWHRQAACAEVIRTKPEMSVIWITDLQRTKRGAVIRPPELVAAEAACLSCAVWVRCLSDALSDPTAEGLRGGYHFSTGYLSKREAERLETNLGISAQRRLH